MPNTFNSLHQTFIPQFEKALHNALGLDGLVMTKLDGTSKGGVLFNITQEMSLPVRFIGIGEEMEDLQQFNIRSFVRALFEHSPKKA